MGNSASLSDNLSSKLNSFDADFAKSIPKKVQNIPKRCSACVASLGIISFKKRKCCSCYEFYCPECITAEKENMYICYRCRIFISPPFDWDQLIKLNIRDLKWYLDRNNMVYSDCKEKEQLVEIILERFANSSTQFDRDVHRQKLLNNMEDLCQSEHRQQNPENPQPSCSSTVFTETTDSPSTSQPTIIIPVTVNDNSNETDNFDQIQQDDSINSLILPPPSYDEALEADLPSANKKAKVERVPIESISDHSQINNMSIKQLKDLLAYNKVDYKGCVERQELVLRAQRLWTAYNNDRQCSGEDGNSTTKDCIICMDQPIDCVLLECGHMVSCVRCGSRLAECPICRQNVVRCLRVFSAH